MTQCPHCGGDLHPAPVGRSVICDKCERTFKPRDQKGSLKGVARFRATRARSSRQEEHNAKRRGGRTTVNSGAMDDKGDLKVPGVLREENKTTRYRSFSLKLDDLHKIARAAVKDELPILTISFEDDLAQQYMVLREADFQMLFDLYREDK